MSLAIPLLMMSQTGVFSFSHLNGIKRKAAIHLALLVPISSRPMKLEIHMN